MALLERLTIGGHKEFYCTMSLPVIHYFTLHDLLSDLPAPPARVYAELIQEEVSRVTGTSLSRHMICSVLRFIEPDLHIGALLIPHSSHERYGSKPANKQRLVADWDHAVVWHEEILAAVSQVVTVKKGLISIGSEKAVVGQSWLRQLSADEEE